MRRLALAGCVLAAPVLVSRLLTPPDPLPALPRLMLWAWESPQDLRFVKPGRAGIAFLARTVWLNREWPAGVAPGHNRLPLPGYRCRYRQVLQRSLRPAAP